MTNRRTLTMDVQELVRLVRDGASDRELAGLVGLNRRTVSRYRRWATEQHLLDGPLPNVGELHEQLQATLPVHVPPQQTSSVAAYQEQILTYRQQGLELAAIRARLEEQHGVPISYDAIWRLNASQGPVAEVSGLKKGGDQAATHWASTRHHSSEYAPTSLARHTGRGMTAAFVVASRTDLVDLLERHQHGGAPQPSLAPVA